MENKKIIASSLELNLEETPSYVEYLAWKDEGRKSLDAEFLRAKFIKGYQTAEKELPTWDDVRKAIQLAQQTILVDLRYEDREAKYTEEEIIEQLKQSKQL